MWLHKKEFFMAMIELKNVSKVYNNCTKALNNINLKIKKKEFVFIVGYSGAGKSTLLKMLTHEESPSKGKVIVNSVDVFSLKKKQVPYYRRTMGIVYQDFRLISHMSVFDNIAFAMRVTGATEKKVKERVPYILGLVGLQDKSHRLPNTLSGGERQRVGLARALVNNPDIIIADEPTGNVDPGLSYEVVDLLNEINLRGTTVVMVTHEQSLARKFNKRMIEIHNGEIVSDSAVEKKKIAEPIQDVDIPPLDLQAPEPLRKEPEFAGSFGGAK
jgi:cell division transport system ATP-binding protein